MGERLHAYSRRGPRQGASRPWVVALLLFSTWLSARSALAQDHFDLQQFNPTVSQFTGFFSQPSGRVLEAGRWEIGLLFNYADDPLVLYDANDNRVASPVSAQLTANLVGAIGIAGLLDVGIDLPLVLFQDGDEVPELPGTQATGAGFGLGDIRIVPRLMLVGPDALAGHEGAALGLLVDARLPTGSREDYQGEDFRIEPKLAFDFGLRSGIRFGAAVGYMVRTGDTELENVEVDDSLTWSVAAGFPIVENLQIVPEVFGEWMLLADEVDSEELPLEALLGLKWWATPAVLVEGGGGAGFVRGIGTPDFRLFLGVALSPPRPGDRDRDGLADDEDDCPDDPEDFDDFEDEDGCPDPDNDRDGILDPDDLCPNEPEDADGFEDADGCPDPDNDQDGLLDLDDACPNEPEDVDGFEDADGCPDPDNDQDGFLDLDDACPNEPETPNGISDEDGCPDEITVTCVAIEISDRVHFETDSDVILSRSFNLLDEVARVLNEATWIQQVRVEGHTDSTASDDYNLDLSRRRAASVMRYLIEQGVDASRLDSEGYGETRPIGDNETEVGRAMNRRVEFVITAQEGCPDQPTEQ